MIVRFRRWLSGFIVWAAPIVFLAVSMVGLVVVINYFTDNPFGYDFFAYQDAAARLSDGGSPYLPTLLNGTSSTVEEGAYLYPPLLAQLLVPLTALSDVAAYAIFSLVGLAAFVLASLLLWRHTGGHVTLIGVIFAGATLICLQPFYSTLLNGNLGFLLTACVSIAIIGSPLLAGVIGGLLKVVPGALLLMARPREISRRALLTAALIFSGSLLLSPTAWQTYLFTALPATIVNSDPVGDGGNLAALARRARTTAEIRSIEDTPVTEAQQDLVRRAGWTRLLSSEALIWIGSLETPLRLVSLLLAAALLLLGILTAQDRRRRHLAAAYLTVGGILLPWTLWEHYLVVLFPIAAIAWRLGDARARVSLVAGLLLLTPLTTALFGPFLLLIPSMLLLLDGIRRTRLPEVPLLTR